MTKLSDEIIAYCDRRETCEECPFEINLMRDINDNECVMDVIVSALIGEEESDNQ